MEIEVRDLVVNATSRSRTNRAEGTTMTSVEKGQREILRRHRRSAQTSSFLSSG